MKTEMVIFRKQKVVDPAYVSGLCIDEVIVLGNVWAA